MTCDCEQLQEDLNAYQQQTPTLEELVFSVSVTHPSDADQYSLVIAAPFPMRITSCSLTLQTRGLPASDSDFWNFRLVHHEPGSGSSGMDMRTTEVTGSNAGGAITKWEPWPFSGSDLSGTLLAAGDVMLLRRWRTGSPPWFDYPVILSGTYAPA